MLRLLLHSVEINIDNRDSIQLGYKYNLDDYVFNVFDVFVIWWQSVTKMIKYTNVSIFSYFLCILFVLNICFDKEPNWTDANALAILSSLPILRFSIRNRTELMLIRSMYFSLFFLLLNTRMLAIHNLSDAQMPTALHRVHWVVA